MSAPPLEHAIALWAAVDLSAERHEALDRQALSIADNQQDSAVGREALKEVAAFRSAGGAAVAGLTDVCPNSCPGDPRFQEHTDGRAAASDRPGDQGLPGRSRRAHVSHKALTSLPPL
eukprot:scaffold90060_cov30-Tisochrysis_lutea.AAC.4